MNVMEACSEVVNQDHLDTSELGMLDDEKL